MLTSERHVDPQEKKFPTGWNCRLNTPWLFFAIRSPSLGLAEDEKFGEAFQRARRPAGIRICGGAASHLYDELIWLVRKYPGPTRARAAFLRSRKAQATVLPTRR
jgi:hypothetical protein